MSWNCSALGEREENLRRGSIDIKRESGIEMRNQGFKSGNLKSECWAEWINETQIRVLGRRENGTLTTS